MRSFSQKAPSSRLPSSVFRWNPGKQAGQDRLLLLQSRAAFLSDLGSPDELGTGRCFESSRHELFAHLVVMLKG